MKPCSSHEPRRFPVYPALRRPLIVLSGAPASGKSTLAARLQRRYGWYCCCKDEFKEILFDALGTGDAQWSRRLSDASFALMFAVAADLHRLLDRPLLLEGNFRPGEHEAPLRQLLQNGSAVAQILCEASTAVREARGRARAADGTRHPGHLDQLSPMRPAATGFLDLPGLKLRYDGGSEGGESPGGGESGLHLPQLLAQIDQWLDHQPACSTSI